MKHTLRHNVTQEQARQAIDTALRVYARKFPEYRAATTWTSDTRAEIAFHVKGMTLKAEVETLPDRIEMGMDVPFIFLPLRSRALRLIESEIRKWLERSRKGELRSV